MSDKLVFDLAQEVEGSPNVFVRKDWLNILDNQNQNYNNNQSIVDTSQLSNSNKWMSYREAYFSIPFLVTLATTQNTITKTPPGPASIPAQAFRPAASGADSCIGLKNWFGQIIHSFTLDYNGTTIVQQTPYVNMWNSFKLMTSLSLDDINTQGSTIGFYPDDSLSWEYYGTASASPSGTGVCNNTNAIVPTNVSGFNKFRSGDGNEGFLDRQRLINFDADAIVGSGSYGSLINGGVSALNAVWKSYIMTKVNQDIGVANGVLQYAIVATVYLKHIHSFFNMCPLLKGVFMKMTMNLNNTSTSFTAISKYEGSATSTFATPAALVCSSVSSPYGGVNPLMLASSKTDFTNTAGNLTLSNTNGSYELTPSVTTGLATNNSGTVYSIPYKMNISVGGRCLDNSIVGLSTSIVQTTMSQSVYLYIPSYTFNPVFEQAYLSSPVKQIKYTDIYQYQVLNVAEGNTFNNLLTNGIANVKSVLVLPFYSTSAKAEKTPISIVATSIAPIPDTTYAPNIDINNNTGFLNGTPVWQSPFDPAGTGPTSPLCYLTNFNVQVSGQNAIYNTERYNFEQFNNQLYGQNAVNGGLTDGITSGLIDRQRFDMEYSYYYVNVERMLPVEMSVPKSIQIIGQNKSNKALDLYCFIEYGVEVSIDALTGARV
jgi:hypothetical protein